jgi:hypothetical protein
MASPIWGNSGDKARMRRDSTFGLIVDVLLPITGAMFWTSPHARLLILVVGSAVALALLAISPARRSHPGHGRSAPTATAPVATPGSRAHGRRLYRLSLERSNSSPHPLP